MAVDYYTYAAEDPIDREEFRLYERIMEYRASLGLEAIPLSASLTQVAARHAVDTVENQGGYPRGEPGENKAHGWSDAPYDGRAPETYPAMWEAPSRLGTPYPGIGFEISVGGGGTMTADRALAAWQGSPGHDAVIVNEDPWVWDWEAIGVGLYEGVGHVWFGREEDPAGSPEFAFDAPYEDPGGVPPAEGPGLGTEGDDDLAGTPGDDALFGLAGDDVLRPGGGTDAVDGGAGEDVAVFEGAFADYDAVEGPDGPILTRVAGGARAMLDGVERAAFEDGTLVFDLETHGLSPEAQGFVYRLYDAAYARTPDAEGLSFWMAWFSVNEDPAGLAAFFVESAEFAARYGEETGDEAFVGTLYENALRRPADEAGLEFWTRAFAAGTHDRADMLVLFADSPENVARNEANVAAGLFTGDVLDFG